MFVEFENMSDTSRVWVYQSGTGFVEEDVEAIEIFGKSFCENWEAHGQSLKSSFKIFYNQFLVISVDESFNQATGCSIDKSVALVRELEQKYNLSFFDRTNIAFLKNEEVITKPMNGIKNEISTGVINQETVTFNNLVQNINEFKHKWLVPVGDSWLKRYFA